MEEANKAAWLKIITYHYDKRAKAERDLFDLALIVAERDHQIRGLQKEIEALKQKIRALESD